MGLERFVWNGVLAGTQQFMIFWQGCLRQPGAVYEKEASNIRGSGMQLCLRYIREAMTYTDFGKTCTGGRFAIDVAHCHFLLLV